MPTSLRCARLVVPEHLAPRHRLVADSYGRVASSYADAADRHVYRWLATPLVDAVRPLLDDNERVLDVAAGTGAVGRHFSRVVSADLSLDQLRQGGADRPVVADGAQLPFADATFTAAVSGFGINHLADPGMLVAEMARVAPVVGVTTWERPEAPFAPKQLVFEVLQRRFGQVRSEAGEVFDRYTDGVGTADAVTAIMPGDRPHAVEVVEVDVPWPGVDAYLDYRLSMPTITAIGTDTGVRGELRDAIGALPPEDLRWRPRVIVGVAWR